MKKIKCDHCSQIASRAILNPRNDTYRRVCEKHAKEIIKNLKADGWNVESEKI